MTALAFIEATWWICIIALLCHDSSRPRPTLGLMALWLVAALAIGLFNG